METKEVTLIVYNRWMDSLEKAKLSVTSPTGKTIEISKIRLWDIQYSDRVKQTLNRFVRETKMFDETKFQSNVEEMKDLLSIASRMY